MKVGDVVNITEQRGTGTFYNEIPLGWGIVLDVEKTEDVFYSGFGPFNLGDWVTVQLASGDTKRFNNKSLEVVYESNSN